MKKLIGAILSVALLFCCAVAGQASDRLIEPRWEQLTVISSKLDVDGRTVTVHSTASAQDKYTVKLTAELQRDRDGWEKVKSWTEEDLYSCVIDTQYWVGSGYDYRLKTVAEVRDGETVIERVTRYSDTVNV